MSPRKKRKRVGKREREREREEKRERGEERERKYSKHLGVQFFCSTYLKGIKLSHLFLLVSHCVSDRFNKLYVYYLHHTLVCELFYSVTSGILG